MSDKIQAEDDRAAAVAVAPRVTKKHIEDNVIRRVDYFNLGDVVLGDKYTDDTGDGTPGAQRTHHPLDNTTICALTLANGFTIVGKSACASPENYNEKLGQQIAYENAFEQIWALEAYLLRHILNDRN
jgi:hypothetical protein